MKLSILLKKSLFSAVLFAVALSAFFIFNRVNAMSSTPTIVIFGAPQNNSQSKSFVCKNQILCSPDNVNQSSSDIFTHVVNPLTYNGTVYNDYSHQETYTKSFANAYGLTGLNRIAHFDEITNTGSQTTTITGPKGGTNTIALTSEPSYFRDMGIQGSMFSI